MAKKTRKQLIKEAQQLWKAVYKTTLPVEQLEEGLVCDWDLDSDITSVIYDCMDPRRATATVRLANLEGEVGDLDLDGKKGFEQVFLYDHAALLKLLDKYLQEVLGRFSYVAMLADDDLLRCNRCKRTNAELKTMIEQLADEQEFVVKHEEEHRVNTLLSKCKQELDRAIKKVGAEKAYAAVEAALKVLK